MRQKILHSCSKYTAPVKYLFAREDAALYDGLSIRPLLRGLALLLYLAGKLLKNSQKAAKRKKHQQFYLQVFQRFRPMPYAELLRYAVLMRYLCSVSGIHPLIRVYASLRFQPYPKPIRSTLNLDFNSISTLFPPYFYYIPTIPRTARVYASLRFLPYFNTKNPINTLISKNIQSRNNLKKLSTNINFPISAVGLIL